MAHNGSEGRAMATQSYWTIGPVAAQLGIPRWRLAYLIERGDVPGPSLQVAGRRLFSDPDVERIREALARRSAGSTAGGDA
jgi:DNA-binding transcriptional MerR regulator